MNGKIKFYLVVFAFICSNQQLVAQKTSVIDSLQKVLKKAKADTVKVNCLTSLSSQYRRISDYDMSMKYAESALELAKTLDYKKGIAISHKNIGADYNIQGNYPEALNNYVTSFKIFEEIGDKRSIGYAYDNIGIVYFNMGNYPEALGNYLTSLKIFEEIGDKKGMSFSYNSIGVVYESLSNFPEAMKNYSACLKISEEIGYKNGIAKSNNNIGNINHYQGNYAKALENFLTTIKIYEEIGFREGVAGSNTNIGYLYWEQGNYHEANKYLQASLKISEEIGYDALITANYELLGEVNIGLNNFQEARKYLDDGLALSKKIGSKSRIMDNYESLSTLDQSEGNFALALEHYKMFIRYKDSLLNEESNNQIALMKIQYETEKKDRKIELLNKDKELQEQKLEKQKILRNGMIVGVLLIVLVGLLSFRSLRLRKKLEKQQAIALERKRIGDDLHDDVGSDLSRIMLLSELIKNEAKTPDTRKEAENISVISQELISNIGEIIWALNSRNDFLENMVAYIRRYAAEYFENSAVKITINTPDKIARTPISAERRRNIFYSVKEALHNIIKHAQATEAELRFLVHNNILSVIIKDNGKGMPLGELNRFGNGMKSIENRMKSIDGGFRVENHDGVKITLSLKV